jgi:hypothetical protein
MTDIILLVSVISCRKYEWAGFQHYLIHVFCECWLFFDHLDGMRLPLEHQRRSILQDSLYFQPNKFRITVFLSQIDVLFSCGDLGICVVNNERLSSFHSLLSHLHTLSLGFESVLVMLVNIIGKLRY